MLARFMAAHMWLYMLTSLLPVMPLLLLFIPAFKKRVGQLSVLVVVALVLAGTFYALLRQKPKPVLRLQKRSERSNFFSRKKDEIRLMLFAAVVGAVLALL